MHMDYGPNYRTRRDYCIASLDGFGAGICAGFIVLFCEILLMIKGMGFGDNWKALRNIDKMKT